VLSIAQVFPGPIAVNLAVASGYQLAGLAGSVVAALGATLPSLVIILIIAIFFNRLMHFGGCKDCSSDFDLPWQHSW